MAQHRRASVVALVAVLAYALAAPAGAQPSPDGGAGWLAERLGIDATGVARGRAAVRARASAQDWPQDAVPGSLLVTVRPNAAEQLRAILTGAGAGGVRTLRTQTLTSRVVRVEVEPGREALAAAALLGTDSVEAVEADLRLELAAVPDDPSYPEQFAHQLTGIEAAWDTTTGDPAVKVAVIDSGIVAQHPDLAGLMAEQVSATTGAITHGAPDNDSCRVGHGTWVAGVIGALSDNGIDVAGVAPGVRFVDVDVSEAEVCGGVITLAGVVAGLDHAVGAGARLVNLSLGGTARACPEALQATLDATRAAGVTVIAASGNAGPGDVGIPGSCDGVISVSAVGPTGDTAGYASTNPYVDLTAPSGDDLDGDGLLSPDEGVLTTSWWEFGTRTPSVLPLSGTSFSAPYVTGVAALLLSMDPTLTPDELEAVLEATATDVGPRGRDVDSGFGLVNPAAAVELVAGGGPLPVVAEDPAFPVGDAAGLRPGGDVDVFRLAAGTGTTEPITQAVAVSEALFPPASDGQAFAQFAVLARGDDFADALAGSSLTLGAAPLLFSGATQGLAAPTATELQRVLAPGSGVLVLGGERALPAVVDDDLRALGFEPIRLAGPAREETAVVIATAVDGLTAAAGLDSPAVILANRSVWYDAITAGSLAAGFVSPILLTPADSLHPATAGYLAASDAPTLYVVGGEVRVSAAVRQQAAEIAAPGELVVLAGEARDGTAVEVAAEMERLLGPEGLAPFLAVGINLTRDDGYAHALSMAPLFGALPSVYLPLLGADGSEYSRVTVEHFAGLAVPGVIAGDVDIVSEGSAAALEDLLETAGPG